MFKPMLAVNAPDLSTVTYPMFASPKLDGIRCLVTKDGALSRNLKPIPNAFVRDRLERYECLVGLDGELLVGSATSETAFNATTSGIMSHDGQPPFTYWVFDDISDLSLTAEQRLVKLLMRTLPRFVKVVPQVMVHGPGDVAAFEATCLEQGYEGVMLKLPGGKYKQGRSTAKEGLLLKVKQFVDIEATCVGFEEQMENTNEATTNALGHTERSSHKANMIPKGTLGALIVNSPKFKTPFNVGTGFTQAERDRLWAMRTKLPGQLVKVKYFAVGVVDLPRFPVYCGVRHPDDL